VLIAPNYFAERLSVCVCRPLSTFAFLRCEDCRSRRSTRCSRSGSGRSISYLFSMILRWIYLDRLLIHRLFVLSLSLVPALASLSRGTKRFEPGTTATTRLARLDPTLIRVLKSNLASWARSRVGMRIWSTDQATRLCRIVSSRGALKQLCCNKKNKEKKKKKVITSEVLERRRRGRSASDVVGHDVLY